MGNVLAIPTTLQEAMIFYADTKTSHDTMVEVRWPLGVSCPHCKSKRVTLFATKPVFKCNDCRKQFTVKVGTIFEDSPLPLSKWLPALWMISNCKNGISSYELARGLGVMQRTAWFMLHRIRHAMNAGTFDKIGGEVEVDETYIGGVERNKHFDKRVKAGGGMVGKQPVVAVLARPEGNNPSLVRAKHTPKITKHVLQDVLDSHIEPGSILYTDAYRLYRGIVEKYEHAFVDHAISYVSGQIHTNGLENFFSLLKRGLRGTYVSIQPYHLDAYLNEQVFRFNHRKYNDAGRFLTIMAQVVGRRLTYETLTASYLPYYDVVLPRQVG
jgi:transposase-like protein